MDGQYRKSTWNTKWIMLVNQGSEEFTLHEHGSILCYHNYINVLQVVRGLLRFGCEFFYTANYISDYDTLEFISNELGLKRSDELIQKAMPFIMTSVIDNVHVIMAFENFAKGILLLNGVLIHLPLEKGLRDTQRLKPIYVLDVLPIEYFYNPIEKKYFSEQTLGINTLLKKNYQDVIKFPEEIVGSINNIRKERNKLHFLAGINFTISWQWLNEISSLINFVRSCIEPLAFSIESNLHQLFLRNSEEIQ